MPANIRKTLFAALVLLGLTGISIFPAAATSITNQSGMPQTVGVSGGGGKLKTVTIGNGKIFNIAGGATVHYRNFNIRMGGNQQLFLLKNGGFRLQTESKGGSGRDSKDNDNNDDEGISI